MKFLKRFACVIWLGFSLVYFGNIDIWTWKFWVIGGVTTILIAWSNFEREQ